MTDQSKGPELTDAELEAIEKRAGDAWLDTAEFIASARTDIPRLIAALRARDARIAELSVCRAPGTCQCGDDEACRFAREREVAIARAEAAEKRVANAEEIRDEALGRADRAEAACAQMRAVVVNFTAAASVAATHLCGMSAGHALLAAMHMGQAALATDVGSGWVSPEEHAAVVAERDAARLALEHDAVIPPLIRERDAYKAAADAEFAARVKAEKAAMALRVDLDAEKEARREARETFERSRPLYASRTEFDALRVQVATVTKERDEARAFHSAEYRDRMEWQEERKALAQRVALLEAVAQAVREFFERVEARIASNTKFAPASQGGIDGRVYENARDALAALDAHDKAHGR